MREGKDENDWLRREHEVHTISNFGSRGSAEVMKDDD